MCTFLSNRYDKSYAFLLCETLIKRFRPNNEEICNYNI
jgi:hypothetical protein